MSWYSSRLACIAGSSRPRRKYVRWISVVLGLGRPYVTFCLLIVSLGLLVPRTCRIKREISLPDRNCLVPKQHLFVHDSQIKQGHLSLFLAQIRFSQDLVQQLQTLSQVGRSPAFNVVFRALHRQHLIIEQRRRTLVFNAVGRCLNLFLEISHGQINFRVRVVQPLFCGGG
jgi:hypothetical protein